MVLSLLNLIDIIKVKGHANEIDHLKSDLKALLEVERLARAKDNEQASKEVAGLCEELVKIRAQVDDITKRAEKAER